MLLWRVKRYELSVDLSGDVALESSKDLGLGAALAGSAGFVLARSWIMAQA